MKTVGWMKSISQRMKATSQWVEGRLGYIYLFLVLLVVLPALLIAVTQNTSIGKPALEFLLGTWPAQQYGQLAKDSFGNGFWLYFGIVLRYLALFFIPAILALLIIWLLGRIRRLETMLLKDYLAYRDTFIRTELYATFRDTVRKAGINDSDFKSQLEKAYTRASAEWYSDQAETYAKRLTEITL